MTRGIESDPCNRIPACGRERSILHDERMIGCPHLSLATVLFQAMGPRTRGTYVHIGAGHPSIASPTHPLYLAGWRGINVEPVDIRFQWLADQRPGDLNLHCAVGTRAGHLRFRSGISPTGGDQDPAGPRPLVTTLTGDAVLDQSDSPVDLLVIYADGDEHDVLRSIDLRRHAPCVVAVDAGGPEPAGRVSAEFAGTAPVWEPWLLQQGYRLAGSDGIDRFYVRADLKRSHASPTDTPSGCGGPVPSLRRQ
jgi:hypothetical protein